MDSQVFWDSTLFTWVILPILIFLCRIVDVSIGTIRIIYVARGMKLFAAVFGFFEILIWLIAITQIMQNLTNFVIYLTYAAGFSTGNYLGIFIENKLAVGFVAVRVITPKGAEELIKHLNDKEYSVTSIEAKGLTGKVIIVYAIIKRKDFEEVISIVKKLNPNAFFTIEDVKSVSDNFASFRPSLLRSNQANIKKLK